MPTSTRPARFLRTVGVIACLASAAPAAAQGLSAEQLAVIKPATVFIRVPEGSGSGFVVRVAGGVVHVVTNHHVIKDALPAPGGAQRLVEVVFDSGTPTERKGKAEIVAYDGAEEIDLAVLKVTDVKDPPTPLDLTSPPKLAETMPVYVCGFPFGQFLAEADKKNPEITIGPASVSSIRSDTQGRVVGVQVQGSLVPGNSGGPVVSADGKLVGVAVRTLRGAGFGFAIPERAVVAMLRGRAGAVKLLPGDKAGTSRLEVAVVDPLKTVKSLTAHVRAANGLFSPAKGDATPLPGAKAVPLARSGNVAAATISSADVGSAGLLVQVAAEVADGTALTAIETVKPFAESPAPSMPSEGPQSPVLPDGTHLLYLTATRPKSPDGILTLSDVNAKPESYVGQTVQADALTPLRVTQLKPGVFELLLQTDSGQSPPNLAVLPVKDLGVQLHELGVSESVPVDGPFRFAVRVKGAVKKPAGRDPRHVFEIEEVGFLGPNGSPTSTLKVDYKASDAKPTLSGLNRFPDQFRTSPVVVSAVLKGVSHIGRQDGLRIANENGMEPINLQFFTTKEVLARVEADISADRPRLARLTCKVERVEPATGEAVVGVTKVEVLAADGKPTLTYAADGAIPFPPAKPTPKPPAVAAKPAAPATEQEEKKGGPSATMIAVGIAAVLGLVGAAGLGWWVMRKQSSARPQYRTAVEPIDSVGDPEPLPLPRSAPQARPAGRTVAAPKPAPKAPPEAAADFPGFDFEK